MKCGKGSVLVAEHQGHDHVTQPKEVTPPLLLDSVAVSPIKGAGPKSPKNKKSSPASATKRAKAVKKKKVVPVSASEAINLAQSVSEGQNKAEQPQMEEDSVVHESLLSAPEHTLVESFAITSFSTLDDCQAWVREKECKARKAEADAAKLAAEAEAVIEPEAVLQPVPQPTAPVTNTPKRRTKKQIMAAKENVSLQDRIMDLESQRIAESVNAALETNKKLTDSSVPSSLVNHTNADSHVLNLKEECVERVCAASTTMSMPMSSINQSEAPPPAKMHKSNNHTQCSSVSTSCIVPNICSAQTATSHSQMPVTSAAPALTNGHSMSVSVPVQSATPSQQHQQAVPMSTSSAGHHDLSNQSLDATAAAAVAALQNRGNLFMMPPSAPLNAATHPASFASLPYGLNGTSPMLPFAGLPNQFAYGVPPSASAANNALLASQMMHAQLLQQTQARQTAAPAPSSRTQPPLKRSGKWCALHVKIAWDISNKSYSSSHKTKNTARPGSTSRGRSVGTGTEGAVHERATGSQSQSQTPINKHEQPLALLKQSAAPAHTSAHANTAPSTVSQASASASSGSVSVSTSHCNVASRPAAHEQSQPCTSTSQYNPFMPPGLINHSAPAAGLLPSMQPNATALLSAQINALQQHQQQQQQQVPGTSNDLMQLLGLRALQMQNSAHAQPSWLHNQQNMNMLSQLAYAPSAPAPGSLDPNTLLLLLERQRMLGAAGANPMLSADVLARMAQSQMPPAVSVSAPANNGPQFAHAALLQHMIAAANANSSALSDPNNNKLDTSFSHSLERLATHKQNTSADRR